MSAVEIFHALLFGFPISEEMIDSRYPAFLQNVGGLQLTLLVTILSLLVALPAGILLGFLRRYRSTGRRLLRPLYWASTAVVHLIRGIPVLVFVLLVFYLPYRLFSVRLPAVLLAIAAFGLYGASYLSEIVRSGLRSVSPGLLDACSVLGMSRWQTVWSVQLPIAVRAMLPALLGLAITVFKDTSVLMVVGVGELTYISRQLMMSEPQSYALILAMVIALYAGLATLGGGLVQHLEKGLHVEKLDCRA